MRFLKRLFGKRQENPATWIAVRFQRYTNPIDLAGQNIFALSGATRETARRLIPCLVDPEQMQEKLVPEPDATAEMISQTADEIHEFTWATQGGTRIRRLLLKDGVVIELMLS